MEDIRFKKLCKEIDFEIPNSMEKSKILDINTKNNSLKITIEFFTILEPKTLKLFLFKLKWNKKLPYTKILLDISIRNISFNSEIILNYLKVFFSHDKITLISLENLDQTKIIIDDNNAITFLYDGLFEKKFFDINLNSFIRILNYVGFEIVNLKTKESPKFKMLKFESRDSELKKEEIIAQKIEARKELVPKKKPTSLNYHNKSNYYTNLSIQDVLEAHINNVSIKGEIFKIDLKILRTGSILLSLSITDFKEAILVQKFFISKEQFKKYPEFKVGQTISVKGKLKFSKYLKEDIINIDNIDIVESLRKKKQDNEPKKIIPLNIRTTMSTMDGFKKPQDYFEIANEMKHKAFAITDLNSVQAFPDFYNASFKYKDIKPIYGATFSTTSKSNGIFLEFNNDFNLNNATYISFDLETTSLSPYFGDIIEFGASKIINGSIVDEKQFFIKPKNPISNFTTELTGITNNDVKNAINQEQGIQKIIEYLNGHNIIAHNANFDYSFIKQKINKYNLKQLNVQVIDSLVVARLINKKAKRFKLENLAARANIIYDSTGAHRANYDASVLAKVWIKFLEKFKAQNILQASDLYNKINDQLFAKRFKNEITILVKKQKGLKKLFKLISKANTQNYFETPTTFLEDLEKSNDMLIGSGGIRSPLINEMFFGEINKLKTMIKQFDYIELPTPRSFSHLVKRKDFTLKEIHKGLQKIYLEAKKQNKLVVAMSEIRYTNKNEELLHKIYIQAKGKGNSRHFLFKYNEENPKYPKMNYLNTEEMLNEFSFLNDAKIIQEIVIDNSNLINNQIEKIEIIKTKLYTPKLENSSKLLKDLVFKNAHKKYGEKLPKIISKRIEEEIEPIIKYGYDVIYWISHKLVAKSLQDGYLVGSRGSVGSSIIATLSGITEVNPLQPHYYCQKCKFVEFSDSTFYTSGFDLEAKNCSKCKIRLKTNGQSIPFETFLGLEANKVPDIDLNFSGEYQSLIHDEVKSIFGKNHVFRAGTISTVADRTAFGFVKNFVEENEKDYSNCFIDYLKSNIIGAKKTTGQHPGGIIVIPKEFEVEDFSPINFPADDINSFWKTTHFDFHAIHDNVLKLDLLGHDDPTAIKMLIELTGVKVENIPFQDKKVISLFSSTKTLGITSKDISGEKTGVMGIPEFGTPFVRKMLNEAKVTSFADLISISGLSHGTNVWSQNAQVLIKEKGLSLKEVISCRDDIMAFLLNHGVSHLKSFTIMENVRKGKGISNQEEDLLLDKLVPQWYIDSMKKILYMFPKAHATAYVMMAWRVAWFKIYYPLQYYATYFSTRADITEILVMMSEKIKITERLKDLKRRQNKTEEEEKLTANERNVIPVLEITEEMYARGFKILNIDLYKSQTCKWIMDKEQKALIPPFLTIDGLGEAAAISIVKERESKHFISIEDLSKRTLINKTTLKKMREMKIFKGMTEKNQISLF